LPTIPIASADGGGPTTFLITFTSITYLHYFYSQDLFWFS